MPLARSRAETPAGAVAAPWFAALAFVGHPAARSQGEARAAPESFADLAEQVTGAVVNISASTTVEARNRTLPQLPQGTPFEDLFEEFFNRRGQGQGPGSEAPRNSPQQRALELPRLGLRHRSVGDRRHQQSRDRRRQRHQRHLLRRHAPQGRDRRQGLEGRPRRAQGEDRQAAEGRAASAIPNRSARATG